MGKPDWSTSGSHLRSPWGTKRQLSGNISELFRTQQKGTTASIQHTTRSISSQLETAAPLPNRTPSLDDLRAMAVDIKETLSVAKSDLRLDIQEMAAQLEEVEEESVRHDAALQEVKHVSDTHALLLHEIHRHVEDLDNRSRSHKLWLRDN